MPDPVLIRNPEQERLSNDPAVRERLLKLVKDAEDYHKTLNRLGISPALQLDGVKCECCLRRIEYLLSCDLSGAATNLSSK